jgi:hypothetical protein
MTKETPNWKKEAGEGIPAPVSSTNLLVKIIKGNARACGAA